MKYFGVGAFQCTFLGLSFVCVCVYSLHNLIPILGHTNFIKITLSVWKVFKIEQELVSAQNSKISWSNWNWNRSLPQIFGKCYLRVLYQCGNQYNIFSWNSTVFNFIMRTFKPSGSCIHKFLNIRPSGRCRRVSRTL